MTDRQVYAPQRGVVLGAVGFGARGDEVTPVTEGTPLPTTGGADEAMVAEYADGVGVRVEVTGGSAAHALPPLGASRRVRVLPSVRQFLRFGQASVQAVVGGASVPFVADLPETVKVPAGATHFAVIRDGGTSGHVHLQPLVD